MSNALPDWATQFLITPARYKIAYGGRGSGKSWAFASMIVIRLAMCTRTTRVICARELQNSIQDSVHQLIADQIDGLGLSHLFSVREKSIKGPHDSEIHFKGLRGMRNDASHLKSFEGADICWIEEGQTVSKASMETLTPTIRAPGSEIWITYNPDQENDPVHQLAMNAPDGSIVRKVNFDDNPWFPKELELERQWMFRTDPDAYEHVWMGECRQYTDSQVLRGKWCVDTFDAGEDWNGPYFGADWGYAQDPTTLIKCWIHDNNLYIENECYQVGCEIDDTPALFKTIDGSDTHIIRADNARPETISYMRRNGFNIVGAKKGKGSIEDGVSHLRSYNKIIIHPRCTHTADEARLLSFKVDKLSGDVLPKLEDKNNHCWDAIRYALEPVMRGVKSGEIKTGRTLNYGKMYGY